MPSPRSMGVQGDPAGAAGLSVATRGRMTDRLSQQHAVARGSIAFQTPRQARHCLAYWTTQLSWIVLVALAGLTGALAQQEGPSPGSGLGSDTGPGQGWRSATIAVSTVLAAVLLVCLLAGAYWYYRWRQNRAVEATADLASPKDQEAMRASPHSPHSRQPCSPRADQRHNAIDQALTTGGASSSLTKEAAGKLAVADADRSIRAADMLGSPISRLKSAGRQGSMEALIAERNLSQRLPQLGSGRLLRDEGSSSSTTLLMTPGSPAHSTKLLKVQAMADELSGGSDIGGASEKLTLLQPIGKGGFGQVYKARWRGLDVAVKTVIFNESRGGTEQRALMEAAVCSSVVHNNVVCTYHYDINPMHSDNSKSLVVEHGAEAPHNDYKLYLIQELCTTSLRTVLYDGLLHTGDGGACDLDPVLTLLLDVARGLEYIHSKNIIHGDLKPENVLLKMSNSSPIGVVAKVTDFGLSQAISPEISHLSGIKGGTPYYQAPETAKKGLLTKSSDVYGYGVLMWEVYNKSAPWVKKPQGGYTYNRNFGMFPPSTPPPFCGLARRCLDPGPRNRPTIGEVLVQLNDMLEAYLDGYDGLCNPMSATAAQLRADQLVLNAATANAAMRSGPLPRIQAPTHATLPTAGHRPSVAQVPTFNPLRDGSGTLVPALVSPMKTASREAHLMQTARRQSTELGAGHPHLQHMYSARRQSTEVGPVAYKQQLYQMSGLGMGAPTRTRPHQPSKLLLPGTSSPARATDRVGASVHSGTVYSPFATLRVDPQQQRASAAERAAINSGVQAGSSGRAEGRAPARPTGSGSSSTQSATAALVRDMQAGAVTAREGAVETMGLFRVINLSSSTASPGPSPKQYLAADVSVHKHAHVSPGPSPKQIYAGDLTSHESKRPTGERSVDAQSTVSPRGSPQLQQLRLDAVTETDGQGSELQDGYKVAKGPLAMRADSASLSGMVLSPVSGIQATQTTDPGVKTASPSNEP